MHDFYWGFVEPVNDVLTDVVFFCLAMYGLVNLIARKPGLFAIIGCWYLPVAALTLIYEWNPWMAAFIVIGTAVSSLVWHRWTHGTPTD